MSQIWAMFEGTASSTNFNHSFFISFWPKGYQERCDQVGALSLAEHVVKFKQRIIWFNCNTLAHEATLCRPLTIYVSNSVVRLMVKFCWSTKIIFQVFWFFFLTLKGELALAYETLIEILNDYYFFILQ